MVVNLFRSFLAVTGFSLISFTFTFWSHHQWDLVLHRHEGGHRRHYQGLRTHKNVHGTLSDPSLDFSANPVQSIQSTMEQEDFPIIHIVYTRFMQHQPELIELGLARMELLKEFFVQSLQGQTTDNFLVVIRTDPQLNHVIQQPLLALFPNVTTPSPLYPFRYLVIGSNTNPKSNQHAHLVQLLEQSQSDDSTGDDDDDDEQIWSGTIQQVRDYLRIGSTGNKIILETRLDSDDGLHAEYLETLQHQARDTLQQAMTTSDAAAAAAAAAAATTSTTTSTNTGLWKMWCASKYLEWQYMAPWDLNDKNSLKKDGSVIKPDNFKDNEDKDDQGHPIDHKDHPISSESQGMIDHETNSDSSGLGALIVSRFGGCLSAGITLAYLDRPATGPQTLDESTAVELPSLQRHETLATTIPPCVEEGSDGQHEQLQQHKDSPVTNCLTMIELHPSVIRARTPTSAGMLNIFWDWESSTRGKSDNNIVQNENSHQQEHEEASTLQGSESQVELTRGYRQYQKLAVQQRPFQEKLWMIVPRMFGISPTRIRQLREYMTINLAGIAEDNLKGQCSAGHSCKDSSQVMLRKILAET